MRKYTPFFLFRCATPISELNKRKSVTENIKQFKQFKQTLKQTYFG